MSNENEIAGLRDLLQSLEKSDLIHLVSTVTQSMVKLDTDNKEDAIATIIRHSPDAESVLRRKMLTVSLLYTYLHERNISVFPPVTKPNIIDRILSYWNYNETNSILQTKAESIKIKTQQYPTNSIEYTISTDICTNNFPINIMARQFTEWFYQMLNDPNGLSLDHLWPDCSLKVNMYSQDNSIEDEVSNNATAVIKLMEEIKVRHSLLFNPNISHEGVQGRISRHGITFIMVCGTLHSNNICIGIFEQIFGLARDPTAENNWKIKNMQLVLRSTSVSNVPRLIESNLASDLLALPENDDTV